MSQSAVWAINSSQLLIGSLGNVLHLTHNCSIIPALLGSAALLWHHISISCAWQPLTKGLHPFHLEKQREKDMGAGWWAAGVSPACPGFPSQWSLLTDSSGEERKQQSCWPLGLAVDSDQTHVNQEPPPSICPAEHDSLGQWVPVQKCSGTWSAALHKQIQFLILFFKASSFKLPMNRM